MEINGEQLWSRVSDVIAERVGLLFPEKRWRDLQRGLTTAAGELGFKSAEACAEWLLSDSPTREQWHALAGFLTIGETYFFREKRLFEVLEQELLPKIIAARRSQDKRLRIWSAGCCTGEESYSLAILLCRLLPDIADWHITILATDINPQFLSRAAAGTFGNWSFRDTPPGFKESFFSETSDGRFQIYPQFQRMVTFAQLNLAGDVFPSLINGTQGMDLILCRNVLMYFSFECARQVVTSLHDALLDGGWLVVSPSEVSQALLAGFATHNFPGLILHQRDDRRRREKKLAAPPPIDEIAPAPAIPFVPWTPPPPVLPDPPAASVSAPPIAPQPHPSAVARNFANEGKLQDALAACDQWLAGEKMDPRAHYLRAIILLDLDDPDAARQALQRAIYLDPDFILAHFTLGNLARQTARKPEAAKHFANARRLLERCPADFLLPESDGLTAGRLSEIMSTAATLENTR